MKTGNTIRISIPRSGGAVVVEWPAEQAHQCAVLLRELLDSDIAAIEAELAELTETLSPDTKPKQQPKRVPLPAELPRTLIHHEPDNMQCRCGCQLKRIGEDVSEKLDYVLGVFTVERHIRGKWVCSQCDTLIQVPVPAQVIDKGIPTSGLLEHGVLHADETPVSM